MSASRFFVVAYVIGLLGSGVELLAADVDFARDVLPVLQRSCWECHGARRQEGELRLDARDSLRTARGVVVPGNAAASELYRRITLPRDDEEAMPSRGERLTAREIARIKDWIDAGADWPKGVEPPKHWAYVPPTRPTPPMTRLPVTSPVDAFVWKKLEAEGWTFAAPASPETLIRRVSLDLIGLPPTLDEVDEFVRDPSPQAYEQLVDRLLASDQFGVRWARPWLDYARYADSHGFQRDDLRDLWPYRDWVVQALNDDMPFTQFTVEQLAGDLLPNATESQRVATGFHRSAPTNVEAGSDPEETRVNQVHDRINTLGMVWLGTTLECAQCHDHKYDPFTQRDYYGLFAFFNNTAIEAQRTNPKVPGSIQFQGPTMEVADEARRTARVPREQQLAELNRQQAARDQQYHATAARWEAELQAERSNVSQEHLLTIRQFESKGGASHEILADQSVLVRGESPPAKDTYVIDVHTRLTDIRAFKFETLTDDSLPGQGPGRGDAERPNFVLNRFTVTAAPATNPAQTVPVRFVAAQASFSQANYPVSDLLKPSNSPREGWAINPRFHESHWAQLETDAPLGFADGTVLRFRFEQNYGGSRTIGRLRLHAVTGAVGKKTLPADVVAALDKPAAERSAAQRKKLLDLWRQRDAEWQRLEKQKNNLEAELRKLAPPTTLVMREDTPRATQIFARGDFRAPGEQVTPAVPATLPAMSIESSSSPTRLDLAQWLVRRDHPLVARVTVNRWWAELFGRGLVATPEDFGIKGEPPTHPELLDWLACEFMDQGWSMKRLLKTIVLSQTYRQSSRVTSEQLARDDPNRLYGRGPRRRLEAELIRDNGLAIAGLLNRRLGGPPIRPYQPDGLWIKVGGQRYDYEVSPGDEKFRRGLYVVWKRSAPYPSFVNFDANSRLSCRVKRPVSNTPLQALTLLNDPVYVELALAFARRVLAEQPTASDEVRIRYAFRLATGRTPNADEVAILQRLLDAHRVARRADSQGSREFVGATWLLEGVTVEELAAWYGVAAALLNLDETITKS